MKAFHISLFLASIIISSSLNCAAALQLRSPDAAIITRRMIPRANPRISLLAHHQYRATATKLCFFKSSSSCHRQRLYQQVNSSAEDGSNSSSNDDEDQAVVTKDSSNTAKGSASIPNLTTSLVKSIVGGGVLALPAGVAGLGDTWQQALPMALLLMAAAGAMNAYYFSLMGRVCNMTGATSYREAWEKAVGGSTTTSQAVAMVVTLKTALSCLAYSMILADSFQSLAVAMGWQGVTRTLALLAVTGTALVPLCLLRDLSSLVSYSFLGLVSFGFTVCTMIMRLLDGSYDYSNSVGIGGPSDGHHNSYSYLADLPTTLQPAFGDASSSSIPDAKGSIVLLCTLATAFVAHYNAPRFYTELRDSTVRRFNRVVYVSFGVAAALFAVVATTGFATFGAHAQPFILNNYSPYDPLAALSRAAIAGSIVLTYPLPFVGLRDGVLDAWQVPARDRTDKLVNIVSIALLGAVTIVALLVQNLALVLSVGGGTFSTLVAAVFPAIMFRAAVKNHSKSSSSSIDDQIQKRNKFDARLALLLMGISTAIGVTGVGFALSNALH